MEPQNQQTIQSPQPAAEPTKKCKHTVMIIILAILAVAGISFGIYSMIQSQSKDKEIVNLQKQIAANEKLEDSPSTETEGNPVKPEIEQGDDSGYLKLPKVGLMIPLEDGIIEKIELAELNDGYRFDVKSILDYREQGYCSNGGSGAIGIIAKVEVDIENNAPGGETGLYKTKSGWSDATIAEFVNNVVYPKEYVTFNNLDAVCYDLNSGGKERQEKVAIEVQEINDAFETALKNAKPIE